MAAALRLTDLMRATQASGDAAMPCLAGAAGVEIIGMTADSRAVLPGYLFAALPGGKVSGVDFIADAERLGAAAVLAPTGTAKPGIPLIESAQPRRLFAQMAAAFYGRQPETVVAVTGTSGKSSTVVFARQIWAGLGKSSASIGTIGIDSDPIQRYGALTTADPVQLHADLAALADAGVTCAAMEASSHGLDQFRLDGVKLKAAGFTSFGRDHLDYHATTGAYFEAKLRLFTEVLAPGGVAVLNADIPEYPRLAEAAKTAGHSTISYGVHGQDLRIESRTATATGQSVRLRIAGISRETAFPLVGEFQLMNALCALGLVMAGGQEKIDSLVAALEALHGVRGRLEHIATLANGASIYVDYAHKPDALVAILEALRPHAQRLVVAFGCGGDRDPGKRPLMGEIAARLADVVIVTDDNPRSEDPAAIRAAVLAGATDAVEIGDRAEAIATGIKSLQPGDIFVIAGKGHEQGQIVGNAIRAFDDATVARQVVAEMAQ